MNETIIKQVENPYVYTLLKKHKINNTPRIINIENSRVEYEYIEGIDLDKFQTTYEINYDLCVHITLSLINILEDLKKYKIVHKDIKPQNIIINENHEIFLIDFGSSRYETQKKNKDTILLGTEGYASPEHYGYFATSYLSDIYSLGKTIEAICADRFIEFDYIIKKATQFDPKMRYQNYNEIREDIRKYVIKEKRKNKKNYFINFFNIDYPISKTQIIITIIIIAFLSTLAIGDSRIITNLGQFFLYVYIIWFFVEIIDYVKLPFFLQTNPTIKKGKILRKRLFLSLIIFLLFMILAFLFI